METKSRSLTELPVAAALSNARTMRAAEVELTVPDVHRATALINATSIRCEDDATASVVVSIQDLAPLPRELERQRALFLGHSEPRSARAARRNYAHLGHGASPLPGLRWNAR